MVLDRLLAQVELVADLLVAAALAQDRQDLVFARREMREAIRSLSLAGTVQTGAHQEFRRKTRRDVALALVQHPHRLHQFRAAGTLQQIAASPALQGRTNLLLVGNDGKDQDPDRCVLLRDRLESIHAAARHRGIEHEDIRFALLGDPKGIPNRGALTDDLDVRLGL
jgi:hypothetical protein